METRIQAQYGDRLVMLEWLKNLFKKFKDDEDDWDWENEESVVLDRKRMNLNDPDQMEKYVRNCCEQMKEATDEIDRSTMEYRLVTEYLTDMEEIDQLDREEKKAIEDCARRIGELSKDRVSFKSRMGIMDESKYRTMLKYESDMPSAVTELQENEEYKSLVKQDLQNLEGEKYSYKFRRYELLENQRVAREISVIVTFAVIVLICILAVLQFALQFEVQLGYVIAVALGAVALTFSYVQFHKAKRELIIVEKRLNQAISVQNTVKIRYVNVTSVIEYTYAKYGVNSSNELDYMWQQYIVEKRERENLKDADLKLTKEQRDLVDLLRHQRVRSPEIWIKQAQALIDPKEMVEIRHDLIVRRQSLRKRIDYNEKNRAIAKDEITYLVKGYPQMAGLILDIVDEYD